MYRKIILVRHAKVKIENSVISASDIGNWIKNYNCADIEKEITNTIPKAEVYITSTLQRSLKSLELLGHKSTQSDSIFNEAELPYADWKSIKFSTNFWLIIFRIMWLFGYKNHSESYVTAKTRANKASDLLIELSKSNNSVLLLGHGVMNRLIIKVLKKRGWEIEERKGKGNLEYSIMRVKC